MARVDPKKQRTAAELIGGGATVAQAAAAVGAHERSLRRWFRENPELKAIADKTAQDLLDPDALATLKSCLLATRPGGSPDWPVRQRAASELLKLGLSEDAAGPDLPPGSVIVMRDPFGDGED